MALLFVLRWDDSEWDRLLLAAALAVPAAYLFYWHRDAYLGPRFLYITVAFLLPLTARAILVGLERLRDLAWGSGGLRVDARAFVLSLFVVCFAYAAAYGTPQRFRIYASRMARLKVDLAAEARDAGIGEELVFVAVNWGNRVISGLRAAGVPASEAEKAYRSLDHCDLHRLVAAARSQAWPPERVREELRHLEVNTDPGSLVTTPSLNGDHTLRVRADRTLAEVCAEEVRYDRAGFTTFEPHLLVNRPALDGTLAIARDLRGENAKLRARYPDRPAFLWRGEVFEPLP